MLGQQGINQEICMSLPVTFRSGQLILKNNFKLTKEVSKIVDEIALVSVSILK
jgi:hypothetical protein